MIHCITYLGGTEHEKMAYIIRNKVDVQPGIKERKSMKEQSTKAVAKKKFFKMVFSRAGIFVILILVQMLIFSGHSILSERICNIYIQYDVSDGDYSSCVYY